MSGTRLKTESETEARDTKYTTNGHVRLTLCARKTLMLCFTDFFTDFEKKN